jgi:branched-chain amino acid transport system permease protein
MNAMDRLRAADERRVRIVSSPRRWWAQQSRGVRWPAAAVLLALVVLLPEINPPFITTPDSDFATVLFLIGVYCLAALGLNLVVGLAGLLDLGYVGFYAVGAYSVAVFGAPGSALHTRYPWLVCVPIAIAIAMVFGVILGGPTLRLRGDYLAIVTLGFGEIIRLTAKNSAFVGASSGITDVPSPPGHYADGPPIFGVIDARPYFWLILAVILLVILASRNLERSRVGRAWLAIREDEDAAELMGVPTFRFKLWAFAMGAAVGGLSGAMFAGEQGFINPESFPVMTSMLFLAAVVIGGAGNRLGVIIGATAVVYLPERFRELADKRIMLFGIALILMSVFRPQGLLPSSRRAVELADRKKEVEAGVNV